MMRAHAWRAVRPRPADEALMTSTSKTMLVFSAHAADFVWRAGGAIALYASRGYRVRILCLSFGERGESQGAWKEPDMTVERVKAIRRAESERAAGRLGADVRFFDAGDYPLRPSDELLNDLVVEYRTVRPDLVLTHSYEDPYNPDHPAANQISLRARVYAQAEGYPAPGSRSAPPVFMFEPHQPEQCTSGPRSCSTSRRCGTRSGRPWSRWKRSGTWSTTTPISAGAAARRRWQLGAEEASSTPRRSNVSFHR
jgi:4-oxalomesaconate hydratase